jgi:hypothetical protein
VWEAHCDKYKNISQSHPIKMQIPSVNNEIPHRAHRRYMGLSWASELRERIEARTQIEHKALSPLLLHRWLQYLPNYFLGFHSCFQYYIFCSYFIWPFSDILLLRMEGNTYTWLVIWKFKLYRYNLLRKTSMFFVHVLLLETRMYTS